MTMIIDGTNGVTFPNSTVQASAGQVLQVVNATYGTQVSTTTNTFVDTGLSATITPKYATSKILVLADITGTYSVVASGGGGIQLRLFRNSTNILQFEELVSYNATNSGAGGGASSTNFLDSPATTSAITYKVQFNSRGNVGTVYCQFANCASTITLMEIAA